MSPQRRRSDHRFASWIVSLLLQDPSKVIKYRSIPNEIVIFCFLEFLVKRIDYSRQFVRTCAPQPWDVKCTDEEPARTRLPKVSRMPTSCGLGKVWTKHFQQQMQCSKNLNRLMSCSCLFRLTLHCSRLQL